MTREAELIIRHDITRSKPWWISIPPKLSDTGKRQKRFFSSKEKAQGEVQRIKIRKEKYGTEAKLLTPADEQQAAAALRLLRESGIEVQLVVVVGDYIQRFKDREASVTLANAWNSFLTAPRRRPLGRSYLTSLKFARKRLEPLLDVLVADITAQQIDETLAGLSSSYAEATLQRLKAVLNHAKEKGWLKTNNPADSSGILHHDRLDDVSIYSVEEIGKILTTTADLYPELVPAVALMTFAGIRPGAEDGEVTRLEWRHIIKKDQKRIEVPASATKTRKHRTIKIRIALASWLAWHIRRGGDTKGQVSPYQGTSLRNRLREIHKEAGVKRIQDGLRHSFASYLVPLDGRESVSLELGHAGTQVLEKHYRRSVTRAEANKFWKLKAPVTPAKGKIIRFEEAA
jgi:integrase